MADPTVPVSVPVPVSASVPAAPSLSAPRADLFDKIVGLNGHAVVQEFFQRELATGKPMLGSAVRMSPLGEQLLYWCMRREMA